MPTKIRPSDSTPPSTVQKLAKNLRPQAMYAATATPPCPTLNATLEPPESTPRVTQGYIVRPNRITCYSIPPLAGLYLAHVPLHPLGWPDSHSTLDLLRH